MDEGSLERLAGVRDQGRTRALGLDFNLAPPKRVSFDEALAGTDRLRRHVLLGNGFSISAYSGFNYPSLMLQAFRRDPAVEGLFEKLRARDFEHAMELAPDSATKARIRRAFVDAVASTHPRRWEVLEPSQREACAAFLANFVREKTNPRRGRIFTTNYDVMLAWVLAEHRESLACWDGFKANQLWYPTGAARSQVHYLHGGLHIYESDGKKFQETKKLKGGPTPDTFLVKQVRKAVMAGRFPTLVSEGSYREKLNQIRDSEYLTTTFREFRAVCGREGDVLFTLGHSLSTVDSHILKAIAAGSIQHIYIGTFNEADECRAAEVAQKWAAARAAAGAPSVDVRIFSSNDVPVWSRSAAAI